MKVLVIMGGTSEEREVSLRSGNAVYDALKSLGYSVEQLILNHDNLNQIESIKPDVVFIALHGKFGEDGTIQGHLQLMGIPYTGSGVATSAICMDKVISKKIFAYEQIPTADFLVLQKHEYINDRDKIEDSILKRMGLPMVVKPSTQGSSIGTVIVKSKMDLIPALEQAFAYDREILIEKFIEGTEVTVAVLGNNSPRVLPVIEITSENDFYDYHSKYTQGMCHHIIPARIDDDLARQIEAICLRTYQVMGCRGVARIDVMTDNKGNPFVLEVNTIPGMTEMSLVPDAARAAGISFEQLVDELIKLALTD
ncbi:MAG: D-alanine--D-alanine ligase [Syntrophomonadaceae bacterium]|nr:D-alanine--D-alanine ligase [Syntrophomonadaceae bacterium]